MSVASGPQATPGGCDATAPNAISTPNDNPRLHATRRTRRPRERGRDRARSAYRRRRADRSAGSVATRGRRGLLQRSDHAFDRAARGPGPLRARRYHNVPRLSRALDRALPNERARGTVRGQLLDDLPMAILLSGRVLRAAGVGLPRRDPKGALPVDICAGWVADGTLISGMTDFGPPLHVGPVADEIESARDRLGWHEHDALPPNSTRRRRRIDVWREGDVAAVECFFRDSHVDATASRPSCTSTPSAPPSIRRR